MTPVRVLIVTDDDPGTVTWGGFLKWTDQPWSDAVDASKNASFHLGEFVQVLQQTKWLGFTIEITRAHRAASRYGVANAEALKAACGADVVGFHFNQPFPVNGVERTLHDYDICLFFAITKTAADPGLKDEAEAIALFMENGGGFFATGDHADFGGQFAPLIPRVRSMRRWFADHGKSLDYINAPNSPPARGDNRIDTTQPGADNIAQFEDQSDDVPQEITPTYYPTGVIVSAQGYAANKRLPHPLLCSPAGVVTYLPDHMHEGVCEVPGSLAGRTFKIGNQVIREYPDYMPSNAPPGYVAQALAPEIVATGHVPEGTVLQVLDGEHNAAAHDAPTVGRTFGSICAWDGHRVGKGRVVVDSTFHHFININLTGDRYLEDDQLADDQSQKLHGFYVPDGRGNWVPNDAYKMIQWYYRNLVYWLIPATRQDGIWWSTLDTVAAHPGAKEELPVSADRAKLSSYVIDDYLHFGYLAEQYLTKARGACATYQIHRILYKEKIPWQEWIQVATDVWDPMRRQQDPHLTRAQEHEQLLGAWGLAPSVSVVRRLALGAALAAASMHKGDGKLRQDTANDLFPHVMRHALQSYGVQLRAGLALQRKLEAALEDYALPHANDGRR